MILTIKNQRTPKSWLKSRVCGVAEINQNEIIKQKNEEIQSLKDEIEKLKEQLKKNS